MKNVLPILLFIVLFFPKYIDSLSGVARWSSDVVVALVLMVVFFRVLAANNIRIPIRYIILFLLFIYVVIAGIIINQVQPSIIFAGIRIYFKYIPIFLLPFAYDYTKKDLKKLFVVIVVFAVLQIPITIFQRFYLYRHIYTGDYVTGSLGTTTSLSIFIVSLVIILVALYLRKDISLKACVILSISLFIPVSLNETKVTPFLFFIGIAGLTFFYRKKLSLGQITAVLFSAVLLLGLFVTSYNMLYKRDAGFIELVSNKERMFDSYNYKGYEADHGAVFRKNHKIIVGEDLNLPEQDELGRFDSIIIPLNVLSKHDISQLILGLGIGNVMSEFGGGGNYAHIKNPLFTGRTTITQLIWETGLAGAILFITFIILVAYDSYALSKKENIYMGFASGWFSVALIMLMILPYVSVFNLNEVTLLFIFFSGLIVNYNHNNNILLTPKV